MASNLMAIDSNQISTMRDAITKYQEEATEAINKIKNWTSDNLQSGFFGSGEAGKVSIYLEETCKEIGNIITFFNTFLEALDDIAEDYLRKSEATTTTAVEAAQEREDAITVNRFGA